MNKLLASLFAKHKAVVLFDCETTGTDPNKNQIIELAAVRIEQTDAGALRIAGKMDTFIRLPEGERIPEKIVELTGITDQILEAEGVATYKAAGQFAKLLNDGPVLMVAHNAQFDLLFTRELLRGQKVGRLAFLDTLTVYKDRRPYPHKLANAIIGYDLTDKVQNSHYGIIPDEALASSEEDPIFSRQYAGLLDVLTEQQRTVLTLKASGYSARQIAQLLGYSSISAVDSVAFRGRRAIKDAEQQRTERLKAKVDKALGWITPMDSFRRAEEYARRKLAIYQTRYPDVGHYNEDYLVPLTADTFNEQAFSRYTVKVYETRRAVEQLLAAGAETKGARR